MINMGTVRFFFIKERGVDKELSVTYLVVLGIFLY